MLETSTDLLIKSLNDADDFLINLSQKWKYSHKKTELQILLLQDCCDGVWGSCLSFCCVQAWAQTHWDVFEDCVDDWKCLVLIYILAGCMVGI